MLKEVWSKESQFSFVIRADTIIWLIWQLQTKLKVLPVQRCLAPTNWSYRSLCMINRIRLPIQSPGLGDAIIADYTNESDSITCRIAMSCVWRGFT